MEREDVINNLIKKEQLDTNKISDGYHTFGELYAHRIELFITLARLISQKTLIPVWRYKTDEDWFLLGIDKVEGKQITYHLPISKWEECDFAINHESKPEWDGHTSEDVLQRLKSLASIQAKIVSEQTEVTAEENERILLLLKMKVVDLDLTVRALNRLRAERIQTLGDLVSIPQAEYLLTCRNIGKKTFREILAFVLNLKMNFGMDISKYGLVPSLEFMDWHHESIERFKIRRKIT